ncbi:substrate-binding domain-containing protein [Sphingomonas aerolata]
MRAARNADDPGGRARGDGAAPRRRAAPDGIFAASDVAAMSVLRALAEAGIDVPTTTAVIGYDDVTLAAHTSPALTTIRQDLAEGAALMVDRLMQRIAGNATGSAIVSPVLIERQSA